MNGAPIPPICDDRFHALELTDKWTWCAFRAAPIAGSEHRWGSARRNFGVHRAAAGQFVVIHLPSSRPLKEFTRLRFARRFCEQIESLADWSGSPRITRKLDRALDIVARRIAGLPPNLQVITGGVR
jgi:hypothetical protein